MNVRKIMRVLIYILVLLYVLSPFDLIPDFFIGAGWIDDLILLGLLGWYHFFYRRKTNFYEARRQRYRHWSEQRQGETGDGEPFEKGTRAGKNTGGKSPYEILGIERTASLEEIKAAYKRLANQYHPDKVTHLGEEFRILAENRFKEIQRAYQDLSARSSSL